MSSTLQIPKAEIAGPHGYLLKRFSQKMPGEVPEGGFSKVCARPLAQASAGYATLA